MNKTLIEYEWDEYTGQALFIYKDVETEEISQETRFQGNASYDRITSDAEYEKARNTYWVNAIWFFRTQEC